MDPYDEDMVDLRQMQVVVEEETADLVAPRTIDQEDEFEDEEEAVDRVFVQLNSARKAEDQTKLSANISLVESTLHSANWLPGRDGPDSQAATKTLLAANISLLESMPKVAAWQPVRGVPAGQAAPELHTWTDGLVPQAEAEDEVDDWTDDLTSQGAANMSLLQSAPGTGAPLLGSRGIISQAEAEAEASGFTLQMDRRSWLLVTVGIELGAVTITMGLAFSVWFVAAVIGRSIRFGIESCDRSFLGTKVAIRRLETNIFKGVIIVDTLEVHNPQTNKYDSPYLLKAGLVHMDIDVAVLICSFFRHVKIERLDFKNVDVIYEKGWDYSNVQDTLHCLKEKGSATANAEDCKDDCKESRVGQETERSCVQVTLHEVVVEDVCARYQAQMFSGLGTRMAVGDIVYKDFEAEVGTSSMGPIIQVLMQAVLKAVIANVAGKQQVVANCM